MPLCSDLNIHGVRSILARATGTIGAPVILSLMGNDYTKRGSITIFVEDQLLADRLVAAINAAAIAPSKAPPCPFEQAAYAAADASYIEGIR